MTKVLLTGATGFVGRALVARALAAGCNLRLPCRRPEKLTGDLPWAQVEVRPLADLFATPETELAALCAGVDLVLHAAWHATPGAYLHAPENLDCLAGSLRLGRAALDAGARFVGIGSCAEYDLTGNTPLGTGTPLRPATLYGAAKAATFLTLSRFYATAGGSFAWCRLFYLHGPGEDPRRLVPSLHRRLAAGQNVNLGDGEKIRDYMPLEAAAEAVLEVALSPVQGPVNICSGEGTRIADLAGEIADLYGRRDLLRFGARPAPADDPDVVVGRPGPAQR